MKLNSIQKEIRSIKMTEEEKARIFDNITKAKIPSPYLFRSQIKFSKTFAYATLCLVLLLLGGSGMSLAAMKSLPGDKLYRVKTHAVEPLMDVLTISPVSKAKLETEKVQRRLDEAQKLVEKNNLTIENRKEIEENVNESVNKFNTAVKEIEKDQETKAEDLKKSFNQDLNEGASKLKKNDKSNAQNEEIEKLKDNIQKKIDAKFLNSDQKQNFRVPSVGIEPTSRP